MKTPFDRREFLKFLGHQSALGALAPALLTISCQSRQRSGVTGLTFPSVSPRRDDKLTLSNGLSYNVLASWGDSLNQKQERFGTHNDFTTFIAKPGNPSEGMLWVNHESVSPELLHNKTKQKLSRSKNEIVAEQKSVGGSLLHLKKIADKWKMVKNSPLNRRIHGATPIPFSSSTKILGSKAAYGTLANCSGGQTPWGTVLSSEENYHHFYGEVKYSKGQRQFIPSESINWTVHYPLPPEHYGWVVEINPWTGAAEKLIALGRAAHEGATVAQTREKRTVVYMGEDREGGYLFKFVAKGTGLKEGRLYAADTKKGKWLPLDRNLNPQLKAEFASDLDVLIYSSHAAMIAGATPLDRPEGIQIDPTTNNILVSLTNNKKTNNWHGGLLKISEANDFDSLSFESSLWLAGGIENGFSCPDNMAFDGKGNLWVTVDMSEKAMGKTPYKEFGNNGLFYIPMSGEFAGSATQVASAPMDAELTGPWFSPDSKTLFLSVQHPGLKARKDPSKPTSHWPLGGTSVAKSSVVGIQGSLMNTLMGE